MAVPVLASAWLVTSAGMAGEPAPLDAALAQCDPRPTRPAPHRRLLPVFGGARLRRGGQSRGAGGRTATVPMDPGADARSRRLIAALRRSLRATYELRVSVGTDEDCSMPPADLVRFTHERAADWALCFSARWTEMLLGGSHIRLTPDADEASKTAGLLRELVGVAQQLPAAWIFPPGRLAYLLERNAAWIEERCAARLSPPM